MSIALESVSRVVERERRSMTYRVEAEPFDSDMMIFWPSGEKRGAKVMPGKLPTASRCRVSRFISMTRGSPPPNAM